MWPRAIYNHMPAGTATGRFKSQPLWLKANACRVLTATYAARRVRHGVRTQQIVGSEWPRMQTPATSLPKIQKTSSLRRRRAMAASTGEPLPARQRSMGMNAVLLAAVAVAVALMAGRDL